MRSTRSGSRGCGGSRPPPAAPCPWPAASYVGEAAHVLAIREAVRQAGGRLPGLPIIAKLERASALEHLEAIIAVADGVMVARGDLGVEVPLYTVPVLQKKIVAAGRRA